MKIIQITDVHIGSVGEKTHGIDVRAQFEAVLNHAIQNGGERIVLTGDLCFQHPQRDIYSWIHQRLDNLSIPFTVISGNHDDSQLLCNEFYAEQRYNEESGELYWTENWEQIPVLFLDTAKGDISQNQRTWLRRTLENIHSSPLIFMHHPPIPLQVPYMDLHHPGPDPKNFLSLFEDCDFRSHIFVGHYHVDKIAVRERVTVYACPSTFYQMGQQKAIFEVDHRRPGYRLIDVQRGNIKTTTHYLDSIPLV